MSNTSLLKGKTSIITGTNRGIGKAILKTFAENGSNIIACARIESGEFSDYLAQLEKEYSVSITPVYFDLAETESVKAAVQKITGLKLPVNVLVNNAGSAAGSIFQMTPMDVIEKSMKINFFSQIQFSQGISRYMSRFGAGSIVNISSVSAILGMAGTLAYGSTKAAMNLATKTMATELGAKNIRVNAVAPSITKTDMFDQMDPKAREQLIEGCALKRAATPEEIANVVLFLASDLSSYVTGQVIRVDGGLNS